jgi:hypothetical protein
MMKFPRNQFDPNLALELIHLIDRAAEYYEFYSGIVYNNGLPNEPSLVKLVEDEFSWIVSGGRELIASQSYRELSENIVRNEHLPGVELLPKKDRSTYSILAKFLIKEDCLVSKPNTFFGFILASKSAPKTIYVVFRGTRESIEWIKNTNFSQTDKEMSDGFHEIYTYFQENTKSMKNILLDTIKPELVKDPDTKVVLTGHSLGGALASLAAEDIANELAKDIKQEIPDYHPHITLYTFASPRVGNAAFKETIESSCYSCYRVFNTEDLVPQVPFICAGLLGNEIKNRIGNNDEINYESQEIKDIRTTNKQPDSMFLESSNMVDKESSKSSFNPVLSAAILLLGSSVLAKLFQICLTCQKEEYVHIGTPICFTRNEKAISSNHNLFYTYRNALIEEFLEDDPNRTAAGDAKSV